MPPRRPAKKRKAAPARSKIRLPKPQKGRRLPPGMVRLDYPRVRGYLVRIGYIRTKSGWRPRYKGYFSDTRFGGKTKARAAADLWLAELIRTGKPPRIEPATVAAKAAPKKPKTSKTPTKRTPRRRGK